MIPDNLQPANVEPTHTRAAFRSAVSQLAIRAVETLPAANGRVAAAVKLVLAGDVTLRPDHTADVGSQSEGDTVYHVNGSCTCKDAMHQAPDGRCKHVIAAAIYRRAVSQVEHGTPIPPAPDATAWKRERAAQPLPEAPASINCYVTLGGRQALVTLRGTDESQLLDRMERLLQRFPADAPAGTASATSAQSSSHSHEKAPPVDDHPSPHISGPPLCPAGHGAMRHSTRGKGWYCPAKIDNKGFCTHKA